MMRRRCGQLLALVGVVGVAATTLPPLPLQTAAAAATPIECLVCGDYGGVDLVLNLLLFIPFAVGLRLLGLSLPKVVLVGALVSLTIECLQLTVIPGRDASLSDLCTNTMGSWIGACLGSRLALFVSPTKGEAIWLTTVGAIVWLTVQGGTAVLLQPWTPRQPLQTAWRRPEPGRGQFDGAVSSAFVFGIPAPHGWAPVEPEFTATLAKGDLDLELSVVSGRSVAEWVPVFELIGAHGPVLAIHAAGEDLVFQAPARAYSLRLRHPALRLANALTPGPGVPVRLIARETDGRLWAAWTKARTRQRFSLALSPSFGWSLVMPFSYSYGPEVHWLTGLWLVGLLSPIAYWSARTRSDSYRTSAGFALLVASGLGLIPLLAGYPAVHWSEWLAAAVGAALGSAGHQYAAYLEERCDSPSIKDSC